jgi:hypothetical protein
MNVPSIGMFFTLWLGAIKGDWTVLVTRDDLNSPRSLPRATSSIHCRNFNTLNVARRAI